MNSKLGIVILNYNNCNVTIDCVKNIVDVCKMDYNIYIVDNKSNDDSYNVLSNMYENSKTIKVIDSGTNGGFSYGNNVGFKAAIDD